jgi:cleavage stimulation factor subunit 1
LWDVSSGRSIVTYKYNSKNNSSQKVETCFNYNEEFVITSDKTDVLIFDTQSGDLLEKLGGHNKNIKWVSSSPTEQSFMSCSEDQRARFWTEKN